MKILCLCDAFFYYTHLLFSPLSAPSPYAHRYSSLECGTLESCVLKPRLDHWRKLTPPLQAANNFWLGVGVSWVPLRFVLKWWFTWSWAGLVYTATVIVSWWMQWLFHVKKISFHCSSSHSLAVTVFVPLYLQCHWDPGEGLWYRVDHSIVTPFSYFLRCSSLHYLFTSMEILVRATLIYRHRKECLDGSLIICPFVKITILEFPLRHMAFPAMNSEWVSSCWVGLQSNQSFRPNHDFHANVWMNVFCLAACQSICSWVKLLVVFLSNSLNAIFLHYEI